MRVTVICTIPVSFVVDVIMGVPFSWVRLSGATVIIVGFALFSYAADQEAKKNPIGGFVCRRGDVEAIDLLDDQ